MTAGRVLFLSDASPLPQVSGDRIRTYNLIRQLAERGWSVSLYALVGRPAPHAEHRQELEALCERVYLEEASTSQLARLGRLVACLVRREAFQRNFIPAGRTSSTLRTMLASDAFDAIVLSRLYTYSWVPPRLHGIAVLDAQNVEDHRIRALAESGALGPRALFARLQHRPVVEFEREAVASVRMTLAVSQGELSHLDGLAPGRVRLVPNGVRTAGLMPRRRVPPEPRVLFVGSLDYSANVDAVRYLATDILPRLKRRDVTVTVIGINPPRAVYAAARKAPVRMEVLGYVEDLTPHVEASRCLVVPLRFGGGTRLKILQALGHGLPVLSTSLGCEGLQLLHGEEIVVADDPVEFACWIDRLCEENDLCTRLSVLGRRKVEAEYEWSIIGNALHAAVSEVADERPRALSLQSSRGR
jgi:glycosyltransferase involved in cell wall biosynthesis